MRNVDKRVVGLVTVLIVALGVLPLGGVYAQGGEGRNRGEVVARVLILTLERYVNLTKTYFERLEANGTEVPEYAWNNLTEAENSLELAREAFENENYTEAKSYALEGIGHIRDALSFLPLKVRVRIAVREGLKVEVQKLNFVINKTLEIVENIENETVRNTLTSKLQEAQSLIGEAKDLLSQGKLREASEKVGKAKRIVEGILRMIDQAARVKARVRARQVALEIARGLDTAIQKINDTIERLEQISAESNVSLTEAISELESVKNHLVELKENLTSLRGFKALHETMKRLQHILTFNRIYQKLTTFKKRVVEERSKVMWRHNLPGALKALTSQIKAVDFHLKGLVKALEMMPWVNATVKEEVVQVRQKLSYAIENLTEAVKKYFEGENATQYIENATKLVREASEALEGLIEDLKGEHRFPHGLLIALKTAVDRLEKILEDFEKKVQRVTLEVREEASEFQEKIEAALEITKSINETLQAYNYTSTNLDRLVEKLNEALYKHANKDFRGAIKSVVEALIYVGKLKRELRTQGFNGELEDSIESLKDLLKSTVKGPHVKSWMHG